MPLRDYTAGAYYLSSTLLSNIAGGHAYGCLAILRVAVRYKGAGCLSLSALLPCYASDGAAHGPLGDVLTGPVSEMQANNPVGPPGHKAMTSSRC